MSPERLEQFEKDALLHKLQDENSLLKNEIKGLKTKVGDLENLLYFCFRNKKIEEYVNEEKTSK